MGSPSGTLFWSQVAAEVERRTNRPEAGKLHAPPR
jgi:hypothetical protein